jgi:hypothetical protein
MAWIESHQELGSHPKTVKLARVLNIPKAQAVGHLHYLWWWATDYAQDGDLERFDALDIAIGSEWEGDPRVWLDALERVGFIDGDYDENGDVYERKIHDWHVYAGKLIERREKNAERMREARADTKVQRADKGNERAAHVQSTQRARATLPNRTEPNQTEHNTTQPLPARPAHGRGANYPEDFEVFWEQYPNKKGKDRALKSWRVLRPSSELQEVILAAIARQRMGRDWIKDGGQYIPHPSTWLNDAGWLNEATVVERKQTAMEKTMATLMAQAGGQTGD